MTLLKTTWNLLNFGNLLKKTWNLLNFGNLLKTAWNRLVSHVVVVGRLIVHVSVLHLGDFYHFGICRIHTYHTAIDWQWIYINQKIKDGKLPPLHRVSFGHLLHSSHLHSIVVSLFVFLCVWQIVSEEQSNLSILAIVRVLVLLLHVNGAVAALLSDLWDLSTDVDQYNQGQCGHGQYRDQDVDPRLHRIGCKGQKWKQQEQKSWSSARYFVGFNLIHQHIQLWMSHFWCFKWKNCRKGLFGRNEREHESCYLHLRAHILKAKKLAEPPFQSKKICGKKRKSGPFGVILGHLG